MADSFSKKENFKKKIQKQKEKALRREERKTNNNKGKDMEDVFMYVDEFGRLTSTPLSKDRKSTLKIFSLVQLLSLKKIQEKQELLRS